MTVAVCLECGEMKLGAWTECGRCAHRPKGADDLARHLLASDRFLPEAQVRELAHHRQTGGQLTFDPDSVRFVVTQLEAHAPDAADMLSESLSDLLGEDVEVTWEDIKRNGVVPRADRPPPTQRKPTAFDEFVWRTLVTVVLSGLSILFLMWRGADFYGALGIVAAVLCVYWFFRLTNRRR